MVKTLLLGALMLFSAASTATAAIKITPSDKALLQASMYQYIDRQTVDGSYLHVDQKSGEIRKLVPEKAHPMIFQMGDYFVLCSDFRDGKGEQVNVDFFMAKRGNGYLVFDRLVNNRAPVMKLYDEGKAVEVE